MDYIVDSSQVKKFTKEEIELRLKDSTAPNETEIA
jgi:hypothetical protein